MDEESFKKVVTLGILFSLLILVFFLVKPIIVSIFGGMILAFIFSPIYKFLYKKTHSKNLSAIIICIFLILIIIIPLWFLLPIIINQSINLYFLSQQADYMTPLKTIFPSIFSSQEFSAQIGDTIHLSITKITNYLMNSLSQLLTNFPTLLLQFLVVSFIFYYFLKDGDEFVGYLQSLIPFPKETEKKLFSYTKEITSSVIYGQVVIGVLQGIIVGISFFLFGVPNALLLTMLTILVSILPLIGPFVVWVPAAIYLLIQGNSFNAIGIGIFGIVASTIDNILRPLIVSRRTKLHSSVILIGMVGGLFLFGVLGLIIGPLIIAYFLIVLEVYRNKNVPCILIKEEHKN